MMHHFYNWLTRVLVGLLGGWEVVGVENIPMEGPLLMMSNHMAWLDPPMLGALLPRRITYMAKVELFQNWFTRWVVVGYGSFPIRRGGIDRQALRTASKVLDAGGVLGMFPEGTRSRSGELQAGLPGVALLALRSKAPVLPVVVIGTDKMWRLGNIIRRRRVKVIVGRPFHLPEANGVGSKNLAIASEMMMLRLAALLPVEMRGVYRDKVERQDASEEVANRVVN